MFGQLFDHHPLKYISLYVDYGLMFSIINFILRIENLILPAT